MIPFWDVQALLLGISLYVRFGGVAASLSQRDDPSG